MSGLGPSTFIFFVIFSFVLLSCFKNRPLRISNTIILTKENKTSPRARTVKTLFIFSRCFRYFIEKKIVAEMSRSEAVPIIVSSPIVIGPILRERKLVS